MDSSTVESTPTENETAGRLASVRSARPFRRYQQLALDAFEASRAAGARQTYLVLPPGAGKTALGLEIVRRMGRAALVLTPNTAVQAQWLAEWQTFSPPFPASVEALETPLSVLTYQAMCGLDPDSAALDEGAIGLWSSEIVDGAAPEDGEEVIRSIETEEPARYRDELAAYRRRARTLIMRGGDREQLLNLLRPSGREVIDRMRESGPWTLVLDECHHLLRTWGYLTRALIDELGESVFVVGLTATPPGEMDAREARLYQDLFGRADFQVPIPALVKEGELAPYQPLVHLTSPLPHEVDFIRTQHIRFTELLVALMDKEFASVSFVDWLQRRVGERVSPQGARLSWNAFVLEEPTLARAALRFFHMNSMGLPEGARIHEGDREPMTADDWIVLIDDYCRQLRYSDDARDRRARETVRAALPPLGYVLTREGVRRHISPVDRVLALSAGKAAAAVSILEAEVRALGDDLRALVVCDYEVAGSEMLRELRGVLDPQAGSAALLLKTLIDGGVDGLRPILVTGRTVACSRSTAADLLPWLVHEEPRLRGRVTTASLFEPAGRSAGPSSATSSGTWDDLVVISPATSWWQPRRYVPLLTRYFESGRSRCLVGTRGLLGEGWDARRVNVLVDLTAVTTPMSVQQLRGRALRLDPALPRKVADLWDVVCIAPEFPKGLADWDRLVRRHDHFHALTQDGRVESGVSHIHPVLTAFAPPSVDEAAQVNADSFRQVEGRDALHAAWQIGEPYQNLDAVTVRVRPERPAVRTAVHGRRPGPAIAPSLPVRRPRAVAFAGALAATLAGQLAEEVERRGPSDALEDIARAVADALAATGGIRDRLGAGAVQVAAERDGFYRCSLRGATREESRLFAESLDESLGPLVAPRYVIPRHVLDLPQSWWGTVSMYLRQNAGGRVGNAIVYHAVPGYLAANKDRANAFQRAWNRYVSAGDVLFRSDPRARAILEVQAGDDPFAVTTQMRTVWT